MQFAPKMQLCFHHIIHRPIFDNLDTQEVDLHRTANDMGDNRKNERIFDPDDLRPVTSYGVYNGHTLPDAWGGSQAKIRGFSVAPPAGRTRRMSRKQDCAQSAGMIYTSPHSPWMPAKPRNCSLLGIASIVRSSSMAKWPVRLL